MPLFGTIVDLNASAKAAGTAVSDVQFIAGAYRTYLTLAEFQGTASFAPDRFENGQIIYVSSSNELYKVNKVVDPGTFETSIVSESFSWPGSGGGSTPTGSLLTTASFSSNTLTFTKGDNTTFGIDNVADLTISNTFSSSQFFSGSLIPEATGTNNGIYDLGSLSNPWRDLYITTASLNFVKDGAVVSTMNGGPDYIQVGNVRISTGSLTFVNSNGDVISTIAEAEYSGGEPVSGSLLETSSLLVTGSSTGNVITLTKGDGSTFDLSIDSTSTSSLLTTASVSGNVITFTKGDGDTFNITVDTGSGGGGGGTITAVFAGNGLTGGGSSGDVILAVSPGDGIQIVNDSVTINTSSAHFTDGVTNLVGSPIFKQTGSFYNTTNNVGITGSLNVNFSSSGEEFRVFSQSALQFSINNEGVAVLEPRLTTPTPVTGGMMYSSSNFYFGIE